MVGSVLTKFMCVSVPAVLVLDTVSTVYFVCASVDACTKSRPRLSVVGSFACNGLFCTAYRTM